VPLQKSEPHELSSRLDTVIKLLAAICVRDMNNQAAILRLDKMSLNREQIAEAVGVTGHNVSQVLYASKKKPDNKGKKGGTAETHAVEIPDALEVQSL
jgi:hypothetical protein